MACRSYRDGEHRASGGSILYPSGGSNREQVSDAHCHLCVLASGELSQHSFEGGGIGYDTKAMRTIVRLRKKDANERIEEETILQTYMAALGME